MKILITGVAGFIASHLAEKLTSLGHEVIGVDNFNPYYSRSLKDLNIKDIKKSGVKFIEGDLVDSDFSAILPRDIEIIFHLAAQPGISSNISFDEYLKNNVIATYRLLEYSTTLKKLMLFINVATSSVYGRFATSNEDVSPQPISYYGVTKLSAEQLALSYFRSNKLPVCSARPFSVYGERERPEKMFTKLIKSIAENTEFPLFEGSEKHTRSYTYVGDIVDGLILIMNNHNQVLGEIFNLGTREVITTGDGIKIIEEIMNKKVKIKILPKREGDQQDTSAVIDKAERMLNYHTKVTIRDGLKRQVRWYLDTIKRRHKSKT